MCRRGALGVWVEEYSEGVECVKVVSTLGGGWGVLGVEQLGAVLEAEDVVDLLRARRAREALHHRRLHLHQPTLIQYQNH